MGDYFIAYTACGTFREQYQVGFVLNVGVNSSGGVLQNHGCDNTETCSGIAKTIESVRGYECPKQQLFKIEDRQSEVCIMKCIMLASVFFARHARNTHFLRVFAFFARFARYAHLARFRD